MVDTVEISRVNIRDSLSIDVSVWMLHPDDWDFKPRMVFSQNQLRIHNLNDDALLAEIELEADNIIDFSEGNPFGMP